MSRKKDSAALFEVISQSREKRTPGMLVPDWAKSPQQREADGVQEPLAAQEPPSVPPPAPSTPAASRGFVPVAADAAGRLTVSLTIGSGAAIAAAVLTLMLLAFLLGRVTAPGEPPAEGDVARQAALGGGVEGETDANGRAYGKYYLVIQNLMGGTPEHRQAAHEIAEFCRANGLDPTVHKQGDTYWVVSRKPFDQPYDYRRPDDPAGRPAAEFARTVEQLGAKYLQSGGKYNFRQRRDGRFDPYYVKVRKPRGDPQ